MTELREMEASARKLARTIGGALPDDVSFLLFLAQPGTGRWTTYVSSAERDSAIAMVEEWLSRVKGHARPRGHG
jgi:hypothetical protein